MTASRSILGYGLLALAYCWSGANAFDGDHGYEKVERRVLSEPELLATM